MSACCDHPGICPKIMSSSLSEVDLTTEWRDRHKWNDVELPKAFLEIE